MSAVVLALARLRLSVYPAVFAAVLATAWPVPQAQAQSDAGTFLRNLAERAVDELTEAGIDEEEKERRFRRLMVEGFDIPAIGRFVLGRYWRRASEVEHAAFLAAFEDIIVYRFLPLFSDYSGETLHVGAIRPFSDNPDLFSVTSEVMRSEGEPVQVEWRIRRAGEDYKILDIVAEGVSYAVTLRAEYGAVLKQHRGSVSALTDVLREKLATL